MFLRLFEMHSFVHTFQKSETMEIKQLTERFTNIWLQTDGRGLLPASAVSSKEKRVKEKYVAHFLKDARKWKPELLSLYYDGGQSGEGILKGLRELFEAAFSYQPAQVDLMFSEEMMVSTRQFVRKARQFDAALPVQCIFQACRNVWIMNGLQLILGIKVELTPSVFAYSMLYPYTDNFVDDPNITMNEKLAFSRRFARRLAGERVVAFNEVERKIYHMVQLIENQYDRDRFPGVFKALLGIHKAQTDSMELLNKASLSQKEALQICIAKGGASVLADGYLVAGNLNAEQKNFLFGYGAYLQLLDDIQDVKEDFADGLMTAFSLASIDETLDAIVLKTFNFGEDILERSKNLLGNVPLDFKGLLQQSILLFLIESVALDRQFYSDEFQSQLEKVSPLSFAFIREKRNFFTPQKHLILERLESLSSEWKSEKMAVEE